MTTTLSSAPHGATNNPAGANTAYGARASSGRGKLWVLLAVIVLSGGAWAASATIESVRTASRLATIDKFTIMERSFSVVLQEKGELQAARQTPITSQVEGRATIISLIDEGTAVQEGDLLVELASDQIEDRIRSEELRQSNARTAFEASVTELEIQQDRNASDIRKAELEITLSQLALDKYEKGDWVQSQKDAVIEIERATIQRDRRNEDFAATKKLFEKEYETSIKLEEDRFNKKKAQWDLEKAVQAKTVLVTYTRVADQTRFKSDLEEARQEAGRVKKNADAEELKKQRSMEGKEKELELITTQLDKFRRQKASCRITAPTQGFVVYYAGKGGRHGMSSDNQIKEGATVHERQVLMTLPDTSEMIVLVRVHESKTDRLALGQRARIRIEGVPDHQFTGEVTRIAVVADSQNRWLNPDLKEYETRIVLDPTNVPMKPGATAYVEILVNSVENVLAVPVQSIYSKGGKRYVFKSNRREVEPAEIALGAVGTEWAEITSGVAAGEKVLLAFNDEHKRMTPDLPAGTKARASNRPGRQPSNRRDARPASRDGQRRRGRPTRDRGASRSGDESPPRTTAARMGAPAAQKTAP